MIDTGVPDTQAESVTYCDLSDVQTLIRGYDFGPDTNPSETEVQNLIAKRTRYIETKLETSFRTLEIEDVEIPVKFSYKQNRADRPFAFPRRTNTLLSKNQGNRYVKVDLGKYNVQNVSSVKTLTDVGFIDVDLTGNDVLVSNKNGIIRVKQSKFLSSRDGTVADTRYDDPRVLVSFSYGMNYIPEDIKDACRKLVVYDIVNSDAYGEVLPDEVDDVDPETFSQRIKEEADEIIKSYQTNAEHFRYK